MPRPHRFKESSASPQTTDLMACAFLHDRQLEERMSKVRQCIVHLRQRWDSDRGRLAEQLLQWLHTLSENRQQQSESEWPLILNRWREILSVDRNWADLIVKDGEDFLRQLQRLATAGLAQQQFAVLREYTDNKTYQLVFSKVLQAFRSGNSSDAELMLFVYLIELINIDLFNYTRSGLAPSCETCVYRGLTMPSEHWHSFQRVLGQPVSSRFVAIPLALTSTSRSVDVALQFILSKDAATDPAVKDEASPEVEVPCLQKVHVIGVPDRLMQLYTQRFPQSVVSTICAVDVAGVSAHPEEQEVLLRGAFFQLLDMKESQQFEISYEESSSSQPRRQTVTANVLEILMVNANRDHLSNGRLGDQDAPARSLFGTIVRVARYEYCLQICKERGLVADAVEYAAALHKAEAELEQLC